MKFKKPSRYLKDATNIWAKKIGILISGLGAFLSGAFVQFPQYIPPWAGLLGTGMCWGGPMIARLFGNDESEDTE